MIVRTLLGLLIIKSFPTSHSWLLCINVTACSCSVQTMHNVLSKVLRSCSSGGDFACVICIWVKKQIMRNISKECDAKGKVTFLQTKSRSLRVRKQFSLSVMTFCWAHKIWVANGPSNSAQILYRKLVRIISCSPLSTNQSWMANLVSHMLFVFCEKAFVSFLKYEIASPLLMIVSA